MLIPFSPPPGLNSDETSFKSEGRWETGNNFRFVGGSAEPIGPFKKLFASTLTGECYGMFAFNRSGSVMLAYGTTSKLYVGTGAAPPSDRTPDGIGSSNRAWSFGEWGATLLASPKGGTLYEQSGTSTAAAVSAAPDAITKMLVTPQRQVLALGTNEEVSGTFNGLCIRWCDLEDYANWTTTSTNNAGEHILEGPGTIVTGVMLGEFPVVLTTDAIYLGQYIGDPRQTYRFDRAAGIIGPVGPRALAVLNGVLFWLGQDFSIWQWAPGSPPTRVPCPLSKEIRGARPADSALVSRFHMHAVSAFGEIWLHMYGGTVEGYWAFSVETGNWFKGDILRTAALDSGSLATITSDGSTLLMALTHIYEHDMLAGGGAEGPTSWHIKSADQYFDNSRRRVMIRSYQQDWSSDAGDLGLNHTLTLTVRGRPTETPTTKGPFSLAFTETKKGIRCSGKIITVMFTGSGNTSGRPRLGKPLFDVVTLGER